MIAYRLIASTALAASFLQASATQATNFQWNNPTGGFFNAPISWNPTSAPRPLDKGT